MALCPACGKENPDGFQFCGFCTAPMAATAPERATRKTVTVLFCDVTGSTALGEETDPEALRMLLARYFERMKGIVEAHGGTVEKFIGDAVMAVFGIPAAHEDDALRACRAAVEMREALPSLDVRARIGISTGEVVTGTAERLATGDAVNVAARLEQQAEPGEILLGDATYALVAHAVETAELEPLRLRGKSAATRAFRLASVHADAPAIPRRADTPFAGRMQEVEHLRTAYSDVVSTHSVRLLTVLGEAGIGKSRLVEEFIGDVAPEAAVLVGRCPPYGEGVTFSPVREIFRTAGRDEHALEVSSYEVFAAARRLLVEIAAEQPVVVAFDDMHWAEETMLDLIEHLAARLGDARVLLVCIGRPELGELRPQWLRTPWSAAVLDPLPAPDSWGLIDSLGAPAELRETIGRLAEGNPLFIEQVTAFALEASEGATLTASIRAVLQARIDRLDVDERDVLRRAAVLGRSFSFEDALDLIPPGERDRAQGRLFDLVRRGLLRPDSAGEEGFRFSHALIRDAVYEAMPKALRAELHEAVAGQVTRTGGSEAVRGFHLERAFLLRLDLGVRDSELGARAGALLGRAAQEALGHADVPGAISLFERARAVLPPTDPGLPLLLTSLGAAHINAGDTAAAESALDAAVEAAISLGDRGAELHARVERQFARMFAEATPVEESTALAAAAIPELEALGDELALARAWWLESSGDLAACRWQARARAIERALEHARRADAGLAMVGTLAGLLAQALLHGPTPAPQALERVEQLAAALGLDPAHTGPVLASRAGLLAMVGRIDEARVELGRAAALNEEFGLRFRRAAQGFVAAQIELAAGDLAAAEQELRASSAALADYGAATSATTHLALLAEVLCRRERFDEAEQQALRVAADASADDLLAQVLWRAALARTLADRGAAGEARQTVGQALALCRGIEFPFLQGVALTAAAEVDGTAGDHASRLRRLEEARAVADAKGNVAERARLDLLTVGAR
ncbi:MAG TPA: adenylate/guanylate cyclase domain-containing protein [Gaiellaceae bacterium]|nr:adenylate/guanylate cyclase domain-containing protein [Gaiellaceae bacterium]